VHHAVALCCRILQKLADIWAYPDFINAAAAAQDPLERMKLLVAWMVAGV
jgi:hypothetical protein